MCKRTGEDKQSAVLQATPCCVCLDNTRNTNAGEVAAFARLCDFLSLIYGSWLDTLYNADSDVILCAAATAGVFVPRLFSFPLQSVQIYNHNYEGALFYLYIQASVL